jgi:hypothetical protein
MSLRSYTLWAVAVASRNDVVLVAGLPEEPASAAALTADDEAVRQFVAKHGMPGDILANAAIAIQRIRHAEPRLYQVPATVLKPKELVEPLATLVLRAYRRRAGEG